MKYYFADTHFNHENIIRLANRPFPNVNEMNEHMITRWNSWVTKKDDIYFLGDFAWSQEEHFFNRLVGRKHLITGNHDSGPTMRCNWASVQNYLELTDKSEFLATTFGKHFEVVLFHYPIYEWNKLHKGAVHLYGHVHGKPVTVHPEGQAFDVGAENLGYIPRTLHDILTNYKYFVASAPVLVT
jgi:calcineurin-like phosphoesterase family protein